MTGNVLKVVHIVKIFRFVLQNMEIHGKDKQDEVSCPERQRDKRKIGRKTGGLRWKSRKGEILCNT